MKRRAVYSFRQLLSRETVAQDQNSFPATIRGDSCCYESFDRMFYFALIRRTFLGYRRDIRIRSVKKCLTWNLNERKSGNSASREITEITLTCDYAGKNERHYSTLRDLVTYSSSNRRIMPKFFIRFFILIKCSGFVESIEAMYVLEKPAQMLKNNHKSSR